MADDEKEIDSGIYNECNEIKDLELMETINAP
jgi:hypothetical protein